MELEGEVIRLGNAKRDLSLKSREGKALRWVSVLDELPSVGIRVLVTSVDGRRNRFYKVSYLLANGDWFDVGNVTHWMPLPEPPKEE